MHPMISLALLALLAGEPASTQPTSLHSTHVRSLSADALAAVKKASEESATVRQLMDALETTDVIAYVDVPRDTWNGKPFASMNLIGASTGGRYVLIRIDQWAARTPQRAPALAHELQHALEVARDPTVHDAASLRRLYSRIGWQSGVEEFETAAAQDAEQRARADQSSGRVARSKQP